MTIEIPKTLEKDIKEFAKLNNIEDVNSFIITCIRGGFNVTKYGTSPKENFNNENKPLEIKNYGEKEINIERMEEEKGAKGKRRKTNDAKEESKPIKKEEPTVKRKIQIIKD